MAAAARPHAGGRLGPSALLARDAARGGVVLPVAILSPRGESLAPACMQRSPRAGSGISRSGLVRFPGPDPPRSSIQPLHPTARYALFRMLRRSFNAYAFLAFPLAVLFVFTLLPTLAGLALALFQWDGGESPRFVGLANFRLLAEDPRFLPTLWNTIRYALITVPVTVAFGFLLSLALHAKWFRGKVLVRTAVFLPTIVSIVAIGFVWRWILDDQGGLVPSVYAAIVHQLDLGNIRPAFLPLRAPSMLQDADWPMRWVMIVTIWRGVGFCMVLYLASLAGIPEHLYEAAAVDGASDQEMVRHITWPMVTPMTVFLLVTGVISALQVFDIVWAMTAGTETASTRVLNLFVYREFQQSRLGFAAAIGAIIFLLTLGATALQVVLFRRSANPAGAAG